MNIRLVATALFSAVLVAAAVSLGLSLIADDAEETQLLGHYDDGAITFDYPANWHRETYTNNSSFSSAIVFLSTADMREPCVVTQIARGTHTRCGQPVIQLSAGEILVEWSAWGFPGWTLEKQGGIKATIADRAAKLHEDTQGECQYIGADLTITAAIVRSVRDNWYQMRACLKAPGIIGARQQVMDMLASLEIHEDFFGADVTPP